MDWFKHPSNTTAAFLFIAAIAPVGMLLIVGSAVTPCQLLAECLSQFAFFFSADNPARYTFVWLSVLPIILLATSVAYLKGVASERKKAAYLLGFQILVLATSAFLSSAVAPALIFSTYYAFRCYKIA